MKIKRFQEVHLGVAAFPGCQWQIQFYCKRDPGSSKCNVILVVMWEGAIPKGSLFLEGES